MAGLAEMSNEQRRQLTDVEQAYSTMRDAELQFAHGYGAPFSATMRWVKVAGKEYLYRTYNNVKKSLGPRSPETEKTKEEYTRQRNRHRARLTQASKRLEEMAGVNRALRIGRVPAIAAKIIRACDNAGLMGKHLLVVGTNSLFAYEARAGVLFGGDVVATGDADLLLDARRTLGLALKDVRKEGVLGVLQSVDHTFTKRQSFQAANDRGYLVDLICPQDKKYILVQKALRVGESPSDLEPAPIEGLEWLLSAPRFEAMAIGEDGLPLTMPCVDPRVFALHKLWLSKRLDREPVKKRRDFTQAVLVAGLCQTHFDLDLGAKGIGALPVEVRDGRVDLLAAVKRASEQQ